MTIHVTDIIDLYDEKIAMLDSKFHEQAFTIKMNLIDQETLNFLSFIRYIIFTDEHKFKEICRKSTMRAKQ